MPTWTRIVVGVFGVVFMVAGVAIGYSSLRSPAPGEDLGAGVMTFICGAWAIYVACTGGGKWAAELTRRL